MASEVIGILKEGVSAAPAPVAVKQELPVSPPTSTDDRQNYLLCSAFGG